MSESQRAPEWYRDWFGEEYLALYPHRDEAEAVAGVELVLSILGRPQGMLLDLACGAGRHLVELKDRGLDAVGLDLSMPLLREARARDPELLLVRGDMRSLPFADSRFSLVVNFFTSFGYFAQPEDDQQVLSEIRRVLKPGGGYALDFLNAERVRSALVPRDERRLDRRRVVQERRLEEQGRVVVKTIRIYEPAQEEPESTYYERVRLYEPAELREMLRTASLEPQQTFGDYHGGPACTECPRYILMGRAT